jgi:hypothetical protein
MGAVASCGLQLYSFGQTVSIPFFDGNWRPDSFYPKIAYNKKGGMHTLCLLDIKVKEPDFDAMMRNQTKYLPPRFMTVATAATQLLEVEAKRREGVCAEDALAIGVARLGQPDQMIVCGTLRQLSTCDLGAPLHSMVLCGEMHDLEVEFLKPYMVEHHPSLKFFDDAAAAAAAAACGEEEEVEELETEGSPAVPAESRALAPQEELADAQDPDGSLQYSPDDEDIYELCGVDLSGLQVATHED